MGAGCEPVVVSDCVHDTDTTRCPRAAAGRCLGEKSGTVTDSERRIPA
jgi:hypothetical protein